MQERNEDYDIVVLGAGAAGMTAALVAAIEGLRTLVIERSDQIGGTTALSSGSVWIPDNPQQRRSGVSEDASAARAYLDEPMAFVELHTHKVQEQVYHVLEGEGMMEIGSRRQVVRKHDVIFIPPGQPHSINNTGLTDLTFIVVTTPIEDR